MRSLYVSIVFLLLIGNHFIALSQEMESIKFISRESSGVVELSVNGSGKSLLDAEMDAYLKVFHVIWFKGIPATGLPVAMLKEENMTLEKYSNYFTSFFDNGRYKDFIISSMPESRKLARKKYASQVLLKINLEALKNDLKANNITPLNY